jgi:hypothetical protein
MMKPICVPCQRFFKVKKTGFYFLEGYPEGDNRAKPGTAEPQKWKPYKLWVGDLWQCEGCGTKIVSGFGSGAISEHYQDGFTEKVSRYGADQFQVNDC